MTVTRITSQDNFFIDLETPASVDNAGVAVVGRNNLVGDLVARVEAVEARAGYWTTFHNANPSLSSAPRVFSFTTNASAAGPPPVAGLAYVVPRAGRLVRGDIVMSGASTTCIVGLYVGAGLIEEHEFGTSGGFDFEAAVFPAGALISLAYQVNSASNTTLAFTALWRYD